VNFRGCASSRSPLLKGQGTSISDNRCMRGQVSTFAIRIHIIGKRHPRHGALAIAAVSRSNGEQTPVKLSGLRFQIGGNRLHLRGPQILRHAMHHRDGSQAALLVSSP
jgi:hypothetical protein